jgi:DNA-binding GntR family transcriptional regulator
MARRKFEPEPTVFKSKANQIYEQLREAILNGSLPPGEKLNSDELAQSLQVSRMPVREAIKRLQAEALVDVVPHKEVRVSRLSKDLVEQTLFVLTILEQETIRLAAKRISASEVARLAALCDEMEVFSKRGNLADMLRVNLEFHAYIRNIAGNSVLDSVQASLFDTVERYRRVLICSRSRQEAILKDHRALVDALARLDTDAAVQQVGHHYRGALALIGNVEHEDDQSIGLA